jgi:DNA-binding MarR family transcriptional regulator
VHAEPSLALLLLRGSRWFDRALLERLAVDGWSLTAAQSLVFAHLDDGGTRLAELARRLGTTRQSASELVAGLCALGVLEVVDDPEQARGRRVRLTVDGRRLTGRAAEHLAVLEAQLAERLGAAQVRALRQALETPWQ